MYKVMLVDDDYTVLKFIQQVVPWHEYNMELIGAYSNGLEALNAATQNLPDLVITDIGMPQLNGLELSEGVKKLLDK